MTDKEYMQIAYVLARRGKGRTSPNPMVGAVIVNNGRIIGQGYHHRCGGPPAEILALRQAQAHAHGARMYVTLEPCCHQGRTPPCVDAIIAAGIKQVFISLKDPNPLVRGKSIARLRRNNVDVSCGLLRERGLLLNEVFIKYITRRRPFVVTKTAQTLDGKIATVSGESKWITSQSARCYARRMRNEFDAILVGFNTVLKDNPFLDPAQKTKRLKKIVLDPALRTNPRARLFRNSRSQDCILVVGCRARVKDIKKFRSRGINVWADPSATKDISLSWLMKELARHEITSLLVEGGARVVGSALREKVVDKMHVYIAPRIIGDQAALGAVAGTGVTRLKQTVRLDRVTFDRIGADIFLQGYIAS